MRDLGHTSSAHTALMEGEGPCGRGPTALLSSSVPPGRTDVNTHPTPLVFFLCLFLVGAQVSDSVVQHSLPVQA